MDVQKVLAAYIVDATSDELLAATETVDAHLAVVADAADRQDFVDLKLATAIGGALKVLLKDSADYTARERALLMGAVRYFVHHDDVTGDLTNPTGFEDDAAVLNAVCRFLARPDLTIALE